MIILIYYYIKTTKIVFIFLMLQCNELYFESIFFSNYNFKNLLSKIIGKIFYFVFGFNIQ